MTEVRQLIIEEPGWDQKDDIRLVDQQKKKTAPSGWADSRRAKFGRTIEGDIIPRLMVAHKADTAQSDGGQALDDGAVSEFAKVLLAQDTTPAATFVDELCTRDVPLESVFLDYMAPAAKRLGDLWEADQCSFTDVTVALGRLQQTLRVLSRAFYDEALLWEYGRRALLVPAPGEQHTFGPLMVAEFMRRAGWDVFSEPGVSPREVVANVRAEWFDVVGVSVSSEQHLEPLSAMIRTIRRESLNPSVGIMVGGNAFIDHPEFVTLVGADATAADALQAVNQAENMLTLLPASSAEGSSP